MSFIGGGNRKRIAMLSTALPIPPSTFGGTELVVGQLSKKLADLGHQVTLFTSHSSTIDEMNIAKVGIDISFKHDDYLKKLKEQEAENGKFDIIHDHSNDGLMDKRRWEGRPYLHTLHGSDEAKAKPKNPVCISMKQRKLTGLKNAKVVYHGLNEGKVIYQKEKKNYLLYVGRIDWQKTPHIAIEVAEKTNSPLIIAGPNCDDKYFKEKIEPKLGDKIRWIGPIGWPQKDLIFADAKAFIFSCNWREPFGLTMLESMLAGTPVIAQDNGENAVNEIIKDGVSGFICKDVSEMINAVSKIDELDNSKVREYVDVNFPLRRMVRDYERLYDKIINGEEW